MKAGGTFFAAEEKAKACLFVEFQFGRHEKKCLKRNTKNRFRCVEGKNGFWRQLK